jgi:hypothetical protein
VPCRPRIVQILGWFSAEAACASRWKRAKRECYDAIVGGSMRAALPHIHCYWMISGWFSKRPERLRAEGSIFAAFRPRFRLVGLRPTGIPFEISHGHSGDTLPKAHSESTMVDHRRPVAATRFSTPTSVNVNYADIVGRALASHVVKISTADQRLRWELLMLVPRGGEGDAF